MFELTPFERRHHNSLSRRDPYREMENLEKSFWGMDPFGFWNDGLMADFKTDIRDEGDKYVVEAELPGFEKGDINVDINDNCLTVSASHSAKSEDKDKKGNYIRSERTYGAYSRSFDVSGVSAENISAEYKNGVLTLNMPKKTETSPSSRRLEIQ